MSKWGITGILLIVAGGVIIVFQKISSLIGDGKGWDTLRLVDLFDPKAFDWIDRMTLWGINNVLDYIVTAPLFVLLFCVGAVMLIISGFKKN